MEDPEQRRFEVSILDEVKLRRAELLAGLLTIWRYGRLGLGIEQGRPLGSYDQWCRWVRDPLVALGCCDPVARVSEAKLRDPTRQAIVSLFEIWWEKHHNYLIKANDIHDDVKHAADPQGRGRQYLAAYLEGLDGTRLGGFVLTRQASPGKWGAATYKLQRADPDAPYEPYALVTSGWKKLRCGGSDKIAPALTSGMGAWGMRDPGAGGVGDPSSDRPQRHPPCALPAQPLSFQASHRYNWQETRGKRDLNPSNAQPEFQNHHVIKPHSSGVVTDLTPQNLEPPRPS